MFRRRPLQDVLARLALAAMLALAVLPTLGRLHGPARIVESASGRDRDTPPCHMPLSGTPAPDRPHAPHTGDDCAYCPLLATLASPTFATWRPQVPAPMPPPAEASSTHIAAAVAIGHLGPRGPPARFA
ncbi:MAG: hypothetical protein ACTHOH_12180 [Lysobacteraceae bacterium]